MTKENNNYVPRKTWIVILLTFLQPGLGQVYNGQLKKGFFFYGLGFVLLYLITALFLIKSLFPANLFIVLFLIIGYYLFPLLEAIQYAKSLNGKYKLKPYNRWFIYLILFVCNILFREYYDIKKSLPSEVSIVPTGAMENTIMTGDFIIVDKRSKTKKHINQGDLITFKYPRDKYVKYVKRCVAGPGDTLKIKEKKLYVNNVEVPMWENGKFLVPEKQFRQPDIFLSSDLNINSDNMGPIYVPKKGDVFQIHENTDWKYLLPIILMEGNKATIENNENKYHFTLQDPNEILRRKGDESVFENYIPNGNLLTPWSKAFRKEHVQFLHINGIPVSEMENYVITQNYYWAMGDNRDDSLDSRYWGFVPENYIDGKPLYVYFSCNLETFMPRFNRIGTILK